jgi:hypothetical protein
MKRRYGEPNLQTCLGQARGNAAHKLQVLDNYNNKTK